MGTSRKLTARTYLATNILLAFVFINTLLFAPLLRAGTAFTAGLATGIGAAWLIYAVAGLVGLRKPGMAMDERQAALFGKASSFAFWIVILAASLLQVLLRSEALGMSLEAKDCAAVLANLGLASLGVSWFILSRRG